MRPFLALLAALTAIVATQARAGLQPDIVCIDPDMEFPVACDEED